MRRSPRSRRRRAPPGYYDAMAVPMGAWGASIELWADDARNLYTLRHPQATLGTLIGYGAVGFVEGAEEWRNIGTADDAYYVYAASV